MLVFMIKENISLEKCPYGNPFQSNASTTLMDRSFKLSISHEVFGNFSDHVIDENELKKY
jgi:hypothetical protein